jgi:hypothetical protein
MPLGSGIPAGTVLQVPNAPGRLQARHEPQFGELQQTPSTQLPLAHWLAEVHAVPFGPAGSTSIPETRLLSLLETNLKTNAPEGFAGT